MGDFGRGELLEVDARHAAGHRDPQDVADDVAVVLDKLGAAAGVAEVAQAGAVGEQGRERRGVDREPDAVVGDLSEPLARIAEHQMPVVAVRVVGGVLVQDCVAHALAPSVMARAMRICSTRPDVMADDSRSLRAMFVAICPSSSDRMTWASTTRCWP